MVFADVFDTYRYNGIDKTVKLIESKLQSKEFWLKRLKNTDVKYGYFENPTFILFCNKLDKSLKVLKYKDGKINTIKTFTNLIVGKLGDKQKEGDLRTPIGNYKLINRLIPGNTFYGPLAFVTSYPNLYDKVHKKNGYGIWIHGKPLDGERGDLSKGCIVLNNNEILYLDKLINYKNSILEITQNPIFAKKEDIAKILATIYKWRDAWKRSDYWKYISFYSKKFRRYNGQNFEEFAAYKKRVFAKKRGKDIKIFFKNISITPYQNIKNLPLFRITFDETYISPGYTYNGPKELYVKLNSDGSVKILVER